VTSFLLTAALVGATLIVVRGTIFRRVRLLYPPLLRCSQCAGFWVGAAAGLAGLASVGGGRLVDAFVVGCATSFLAHAADAAFILMLGDPLDDDTPPPAH
jgi:hypothetical protein